MSAAKRRTGRVLQGLGTAQPPSIGVISRPLLDQFSDLPQPLQSYILALGGAPLDTCKAAADVLDQSDLTATWLAATTDYPVESAAVAQKWDAVLHLLNNSSLTQLPYRKATLPALLGLAAKHGRIDVVQRLIPEGAWDQVCETQHNPEFMLLPSRARPGHPGSQRTAGIYIPHPLICAAEGGRAEVVALLLNQPGVPVPAFIGRQALCSAAQAGSIPTMQLLVTSVPGISAPHIGPNPLSSAAIGGHIPALQFLLQQGAHPNNKAGTPFSYCSAYCPMAAAVSSNRSAELIQFLLEQGIHWERLSTALGCAAAGGNVQVVQLLLSRYPELTRSSKCCALKNAASHGNTAVMRLLLEAGKRMPRNSIAHAFNASAQAGNVQGLALLRQHGADVNCTVGGWREPKTPIQHALLYNHAAAVQWLLDNGATAEQWHLQEAIECGAADAARQLVQHGVRDEQNKALRTAARKGFTDVVELLLDAPLPAAQEEAAAVRAERMDVAFCAASSHGQAEAVRSLLERLPPASSPGAAQSTSGTGAVAARAAAAGATDINPEGDCSTDEQSSDTDKGCASSKGARDHPSGSNLTQVQAGGRNELLHRAMEAAATGADYCPDHSHLGTHQQRQAACSSYKCSEIDAGLNAPSESSSFGEVTGLLVAAGVDPTYDDCRFLKRAIQRHNSHMIDALLPLCSQHPAVVSGAALLQAVKAGFEYAMERLQVHSRLNRSMHGAMEKVILSHGENTGSRYKRLLMM
jgi:ankyrin repeat protein